MDWLKRLLAHPDAPPDTDLDSAECTEARKKIILEGRFLRRVYKFWYGAIASEIPVGDELVVEIGSGAGFFKDFMSPHEVVTTDLISLRDVDRVLDAQEIDSVFTDGSLRGITMVNVLHHLPDVRRFFSAAEKSLCPGGVVSMIEPWVSNWAGLIYRNLHHEAYEPERSDWDFETTGPLSGSNQALPWIIFSRDREIFESEFPNLELKLVRPTMPFSYLVSGGVSMRPLQPGWMFRPWRSVERLLDPFRDSLSMFAQIVLRKKRSGD